jgi:hypothetical protein
MTFEVKPGMGCVQVNCTEDGKYLGELIIINNKTRHGEINHLLRELSQDKTVKSFEAYVNKVLVIAKELKTQLTVRYNFSK